MELDIHERDIDTRLCQACGACCRITFKLPNTTSRYRRFLRQIGYTVLPRAKVGKADCCEKKHDVTLDMDYCKHLEIREHAEGITYRCRIYKTGRYPQLCAQYNCVSWAKANDAYNSKNSLLMNAQKALDRLRALDP